MSLFSNLFKKKEGGTLFGNLLRVGASKLTGGIMGTGAGIIPIGTAAAAADAAELASLRAGAAAGGAAIVASTAVGAGSALGSLIGSQNPSTVDQNVGIGYAISWLKSNWYLIAFPLLGLFYYFFIYKKKN